MAKEKKEPKHKHKSFSFGGFVFHLVIGVGLLFAMWYYWPTFEAALMNRYGTQYHSVIDPRFVLDLYLLVMLLAILFISNFINRFGIFLGSFLPLVVYVGYQEWVAHTNHLPYIDVTGVLSMLYAIFTKRTW